MGGFVPGGGGGTPGPPGPAGPQGPPGASIVIQGTVPSEAQLPPTGNVGDAWITADTGHIWIWDGTRWVDGGPVQGPPGAQGPQGPAGPVVPATATTLGGVIIGANIAVLANGTISVAAPYVLPVATAAVLGGVRQGAGVTIAADGTLAAIVTSVFGRGGAVVPAAGDYTAAQVTNAVSTLGSYPDPIWIPSLAWGKITGVPSVSSYQTPWLSNINGGAFNLTNVANITTTPAGSIVTNQCAIATVLNASYPLAVNGSAAFGPVVPGAIVAGRTAVTIRGTTEAGSVILSQSSADANQQTIGNVSWLDSNNTSGNNTAFVMQVYTSGTTANNRGASMVIFVRADNSGAVSSRLTIDNTGRLGLNINPQCRLDVGGCIRAQNVEGPTAGAGLEMFYYPTGTFTGGQIQGYDRNTNSFQGLALDGSFTIINLNSMGNVGIHTATPGFPLSLGSAGGRKLAIYDSGVGDFYGLGLTPGNLQYDAGIGGNHVFGVNNNTISGLIISNAGAFTVASDTPAKPTPGQWSGGSDARLKENIEPFTEGLSTLLQLAPRKFQFNGEHGIRKGLAGVGLVAQEVQSVIPRCVSAVPGKIAGEETEILMGNWSELTWMMLNALKEIDRRLKTGGL